MPKKIAPLSEAAPRNAKYPKDKTQFDGGGLYLEVRPTAKVWRFKYRFDGKSCLMTFGHYPDLSLAAAREIRQKALALLAKGINPHQKRERDESIRKLAAENSYEAVCRAWLEEKRSTVPVRV